MVKRTTWIFHDTITAAEVEIYGSDLFTCADNNVYKAISFSAAPNMSYTNNVGGTGKRVYKNGAWVSSEYKEVTFMREPDYYYPDEATFMTWLEANATQIPINDPRLTVSRFDLEDLADAIRSRTGGSSPLVFPAGFVSGIESIGDQASFLVDAPAQLDQYSSCTVDAKSYEFYPAVSTYSGDAVLSSSFKNSVIDYVYYLESVELRDATTGEAIPTSDAMCAVIMKRVGTPNTTCEYQLIIVNNTLSTMTVKFYKHYKAYGIHLTVPE